MAKLFATDMCMKVTTDAVQVLGGAGYVARLPRRALVPRGEGAADRRGHQPGAAHGDRTSSAGGTDRVGVRGGHRPRDRPPADAGRTHELHRPGPATGLSTSAVHQRVRRLEQRGVITGYKAVVVAGRGRPAADRVHLRHPLDPSAPDDAPERLADLPEIEACHSVAGEESYILKVRVATPSALEDLLARVRSEANLSTRTTVVLSTPYENRPPAL